MLGGNRVGGVGVKGRGKGGGCLKVGEEKRGNREVSGELGRIGRMGVKRQRKEG